MIECYKDLTRRQGFGKFCIKVLEFGVGGDEDSAWCSVVLMWSRRGRQLNTGWYKYVSYLGREYGGVHGVYGRPKQWWCCKKQGGQIAQYYVFFDYWCVDQN